MLTAVFDFFKRTAVVSAFSIGLLLILGWLLKMVQREYAYDFFSYRIRLLDNIPAWFAFSMILIFLNGRYLIKVSALEGRFDTPDQGMWGNWRLHFPIPPFKILGYNLITIPVLLFAFVLVRWFNL